MGSGTLVESTLAKHWEEWGKRGKGIGIVSRNPSIAHGTVDDPPSPQILTDPRATTSRQLPRESIHIFTDTGLAFVPSSASTTMGTVASRPSSSSFMPGALAMDSTPSLASSEERVSTPFPKTDDGVSPDVITLQLAQEDQHNHSELSQRSRLKTQSPGNISFAGLRDPFYQPSNIAVEPDLPITPPSVTAQSGEFNTPSSSDPSTPLTPIDSSTDNTPSIYPSMTAVHFHSPSSQIVGTPFATTSAPFEYPFPTTQSSSNMSHFTSPASSSLSVTPHPPSPTAPTLVPAVALPSTSVALSLSLAVPHDLDYAPNGALALAHPKMRVASPPVPPSLLKKRRERMQAAGRRSTVDVSGTVLGHAPVQHAMSDGNLKARAATRRGAGGHAVRG